MIATGSENAVGRLSKRGTAELARAQDDCVVQHSPLLEVLQEGRTGLIHALGFPSP